MQSNNKLKTHKATIGFWSAELFSRNIKTIGTKLLKEKQKN